MSIVETNVQWSAVVCAPKSGDQRVRNVICSPTMIGGRTLSHLVCCPNYLWSLIICHANNLRTEKVLRTIQMQLKVLTQYWSNKRTSGTTFLATLVCKIFFTVEVSGTHRQNLRGVFLKTFHIFCCCNLWAGRAQAEPLEFQHVGQWPAFGFSCEVIRWLLWNVEVMYHMAPLSEFDSAMCGCIYVYMWTTLGGFTHPKYSLHHMGLFTCWGCQTRQGPHLSIRIVVWILSSDTETSAGTPWELMRKK